MIDEIEKLRAKAPPLTRLAVDRALRNALTDRYRKGCEIMLAAIERPDAYQPETHALIAARVAKDSYCLADGFDELFEIACKSLGVK